MRFDDYNYNIWTEPSLEKLQEWLFSLLRLCLKHLYFHFIYCNDVTILGDFKFLSKVLCGLFLAWCWGCQEIQKLKLFFLFSSIICISGHWIKSTNFMLVKMPNQRKCNSDLTSQLILVCITHDNWQKTSQCEPLFLCEVNKINQKEIWKSQTCKTPLKVV